MIPVSSVTVPHGSLCGVLPPDTYAALVTTLAQLDKIDASAFAVQSPLVPQALFDFPSSPTTPQGPHQRQQTSSRGIAQMMGTRDMERPASVDAGQSAPQSPYHNIDGEGEFGSDYLWTSSPSLGSAGPARAALNADGRPRGHHGSLPSLSQPPKYMPPSVGAEFASTRPTQQHVPSLHLHSEDYHPLGHSQVAHQGIPFIPEDIALLHSDIWDGPAKFGLNQHHGGELTPPSPHSPPFSRGVRQAPSESLPAYSAPTVRGLPSNDVGMPSRPPQFSALLNSNSSRAPSAPVPMSSRSGSGSGYFANASSPMVGGNAFGMTSGSQLSTTPPSSASRSTPTPPMLENSMDDDYDMGEAYEGNFPDGAPPPHEDGTPHKWRRLRYKRGWTHYTCAVCSRRWNKPAQWLRDRVEGQHPQGAPSQQHGSHGHSSYTAASNHHHPHSSYNGYHGHKNPDHHHAQQYPNPLNQSRYGGAATGGQHEQLAAALRVLLNNQRQQQMSRGEYQDKQTRQAIVSNLLHNLVAASTSPEASSKLQALPPGPSHVASHPHHYPAQSQAAKPQQNQNLQHPEGPTSRQFFDLLVTLLPSQ